MKEFGMGKIYFNVTVVHVWKSSSFSVRKGRDIFICRADEMDFAKIALKRSVEKVILQGIVPYIVKKKKIEKLNCLSV